MGYQKHIKDIESERIMGYLKEKKYEEVLNVVDNMNSLGQYVKLHPCEAKTLINILNEEEHKVNIFKNPVKYFDKKFLYIKLNSLYNSN